MSHQEITFSVQGTTSRISPGTAAPDTSDTTYAAQMGLGTYAKGSSDDASLNASFPANPISADSITSIQATFQDMLDGDQSSNIDFGTVDMDYGDAPVLLAEEAIKDYENNLSGKGKGMPAGPFVPTTASPNGTTNPDDQPEIDPVPGHGGDLGHTSNPARSTYSYTIGAGVMGEAAGG